MDVYARGSLKMCAVSMVIDHYNEDWRRRYYPVNPEPNFVPKYPFWPSNPPQPSYPSSEDIESLRKLIERAKEYDAKNNEPHCEMDEKKKKLLDLAKELGVEINFL